MVALNRYKLYFHLNPKTGIVFYVGIGLRSRHLDKNHRNPHWNNYVSKYGLKVVIIENNLTKEQAIEKEIYWIKLLGRKDKGMGELLNYTDGGEGAFGAVRSKEVRERMSVAAKKRKKHTPTERHKNNISKALKGKTHSQERRFKNSISKKLAHATNPNMGMRGKVCSDETKRKIGQANKVSVKKYWDLKAA